jgi:DNA topoisomerase III
VIVVLAEKPSVARDIGAVLGATQRRNGYLLGRDYCVTWALGHLVRLAEPDEIDVRWSGLWRCEQLPMLPSSIPLLAVDKTREQFEIVKSLVCDPQTKLIVNAADAAREGELIFERIYQATGATAPVKRLWISSLTPSAIEEGFRRLQPSAAYANLAAAARARSEADWLVGMNLTRAYTLASGLFRSVGRVQSPTLQLVVTRDLAIAKHVPEIYCQVHATFTVAAGEFEAVYIRRITDPKTGAPKDSSMLPAHAPGLPYEEDAQGIVERALRGKASILHVERKSTVHAPPRFFDLTELQREANRLWGWTALDTLGVAQRLYEEYKLLSYPRTDSNHLPVDVAATLPGIVAVVSGPYRDLLVEGTGRTTLTKRHVDDAQVSDHHAIIPTMTEPRQLRPGTREAQLYDLVVRRLLQAWQPDHVEDVVVVDLAITDGSHRDRYRARGQSTAQAGWTVLRLSANAPRADAALPPRLVAGSPVSVRGARVKQDKTKPPSPFTEAELLTAMESAGRALPAELARAMKERGLGTPATRAATIETLIARNYVVREGKSLRSTENGRELVAILHPHVTSPSMTAEWEERLNKLAQGEGSLGEFLRDVKKFVAHDVGQALVNGPAPRRSAKPTVIASKASASSTRKPRTRRVAKEMPIPTNTSHRAGAAAPSRAPRRRP